MIKLISPEKFKQTPWKNGKGITTELAINEGGTVSDFEWRLSIANVVENGIFSNFRGYQRHLVLIKGNGIELTHNNNSIDKLENILDSATFDGNNKTVATLTNEPIKDFNVITKQSHYISTVNTIKKSSLIKIKHTTYCFIYCLNSDALLTIDKGRFKQAIPQGHLAVLTNYDKDLNVTGDNIVITYLKEIK